MHRLVVPISRDLTGGAGCGPAEAEPIRLAVVFLSLLAAWAVWEYLERPMNRLMHSVALRRPATEK